MSPHIAIDQALEALEHPGNRDLDESLTEGLIVRHFTAGDITAEEFNHYCQRLRDTCQRRKEAA